MPAVTRSSNMPPAIHHPPAGTQTSDRYGNVISTRPAPPPPAAPSAPSAPTCDRWGNIISAPADWSPNPRNVPIPGTNYVPNAKNVVEWK